MPHVVVDIPEPLWDTAARRARAASRSLEDYLSEHLRSQLLADPVTAAGNTAGVLEALEALDLSALTDEQLLTHIDARVPESMQDRLTDLQARNSAEGLTAAELDDFDRILNAANASAILKAQALLAWKSRYGKLPEGIGESVR